MFNNTMDIIMGYIFHMPLTHKLPTQATDAGPRYIKLKHVQFQKQDNCDCANSPYGIMGFEIIKS